jgi:tRNA-dihydrouridine synthase
MEEEKKQGYTGQADWDAIAAVKQRSYSCFTNGDVRTQDDIRLILGRTGCDGVMIGRGAMDNPWIFSGRDRHEIPDQEVLNTMLFHLDEMVAFYGEERGPVLFRKYAKRILMATQISQDQLTRLLTEPDHNQVRRMLAEQIG